ncbi:MAG TPA: arginase, partial [Castellaniella sp.]|nr:arginase [Castellaniella sp.]
MSKTIALVGVPTDIGAGARGASMGPEALRVAGLVHALEARGRQVLDTGNLSGPANPWLPPEQGYRHLPQVIAWNQAVHAAVSAQLHAGRLPMMLGGDHCLGVGSVGAVARHCRSLGRPLRVFWLDAHADFNTAEISPSGNIHGMPVACLCGLGPEPLTSLSGATPAISPDAVRQIGIRSVDPKEKRLVHDMGIEIYDMRYIDEHGMRRVMEEALDGMDADTHLHVSFDVDFLDPSI